MTTRKIQQRRARLMPGGIPRWIRVYDLPNTADRYTVVFSKKATRYADGTRTFDYIGMSSMPFHPQGIGQHGESKWHPVDRNGSAWPPAIGRKCHLGTRIRFEDLPADCQKLVLSDYKELWQLNYPQATR